MWSGEDEQSLLFAIQALQLFQFSLPKVMPGLSIGSVLHMKKLKVGQAA